MKKEKKIKEKKVAYRSTVNEEPEGPNLPPKKNNVMIKILDEIKGGKYVEIKGVIGAFAAVAILISYIVYYYFYYYNDVKLNELYFISSGIGTSIFTGLLFTFFKNIYVKTILLFTCVFYLILEIIFVIVWIIYGHPYAYLKQALIIGLIAGVIYFIYDTVTNKPRSSDNNSIIPD